MMLAAENLAIGHGKGAVASGLSFQVAAGEVLCLLGPNGSGKTTLLRTLLGLLRPLAGRVLCAGEDMAGWDRKRIARTIAYVPQAHAAPFPFTVFDTVLMGRAVHMRPFAQPGAHDRTVAQMALADLDLTPLADRPYTEISGGERQLVLIARALAQEPRILVMDEPAASLDLANQVRVLRQVAGLAARGLSVIMSTHDPDHALICGGQALLLRQGRVLGLGAAREVITAASLSALYDIQVELLPVPGQDRHTYTTIIAKGEPS